MKETKQLEDKINDNVIKEIKDNIQYTANSAAITNHEVEGNSYLKVKVKPKVKFGELMKGDMMGAFGKSSVNLEFGKSFANDNVEISIKVNGNLYSVLNSPSGSKSVNAEFIAIKRF